MNDRIEMFSTLLNESETHLTVTNISEISIELENGINEASDDNSCSLAIKVNPF
jgi:hypothetical protein